MVTNNPTKFEWNPLSGLRGVASTNSTVAYVQKNQQSPITRVKFVESKWRYNMINYIPSENLTGNPSGIPLESQWDTKWDPVGPTGKIRQIPWDPDEFSHWDPNQFSQWGPPLSR